MNITSPQPLSEGEGLNSRYSSLLKSNMILPFFIGLILMSCGNNTKPSSTPALQAVAPAPIEKITIARDSVVQLSIPSAPNQSYSIYYPSKAKTAEAAPILLCFDPHGDGRIPVDKYKKWADKFGIAIAGSNSSRNGLSNTETDQIATNMISDINGRLGFDKKNMTLCGFSGGAKVAISAISAEGNISNLIYAGAVTALNSAKPLNILGFAGNQDMNYTDLLQFDESIRTSNPNSTLIEFNGKHAWPDAKIFEDAFYWITFQSYRQNPSLKDSSIIQKFANDCHHTIVEAGEIKNDAIKVYQTYLMEYNFLNGLTDVSDYKAHMETMANSDIYKKPLAEKNQTLQKEAGTKQVLMQAFQNQNPDWWTKVIKGYQSSSNPSDKRLLGFISLAGFSYSNQLLQQHNLDGAERMLSIYEMADPSNTDQLYFHSMLYAQKGNNALAIKYLQKAVANGFKDKAKMDAEPSFTPQLKSDPGYVQIEAALKKASR